LRNSIKAHRYVLRCDLADVDQADLSTGIRSRRIDRHELAVSTTSGVRITPPFVVVFDRRAEVPQSNFVGSIDLVQIRSLDPAFIGIRVVEYPFSIWQVSAMPVTCHYILPDDLDLPVTASGRAR
jgi:hypothetical protein